MQSCVCMWKYEQSSVSWEGNDRIVTMPKQTLLLGVIKNVLIFQGPKILKGDSCMKFQSLATLTYIMTLCKTFNICNCCYFHSWYLSCLKFLIQTSVYAHHTHTHTFTHINAQVCTGRKKYAYTNVHTHTLFQASHGWIEESSSFGVGILVLSWSRYVKPHT